MSDDGLRARREGGGGGVSFGLNARLGEKACTDSLDLGLEVLGHDTLGDLLEKRLLLGLEVLLEVGVPLDNVLNGNGVEETVDSLETAKETKRLRVSESSYTKRREASGRRDEQRR